MGNFDKKLVLELKYGERTYKIDCPFDATSDESKIEFVDDIVSLYKKYNPNFTLAKSPKIYIEEQ